MKSTLKKEIDNTHLFVIFEQVLPEFAKNGIKCWVYGGVGVAAVAGRFLRVNKDVDTYVLEKDFPKVELMLKKLCQINGSWDGNEWRLEYSVLRTNQRPKFELNIHRIGRFSVMPIYKAEDGYEHRLPVSRFLPRTAIVEEKRNLEGFAFTTPSDEVIKKMIGDLVKFELGEHEAGKPFGGMRWVFDARTILSQEEFDPIADLLIQKGIV